MEPQIAFAIVTGLLSGLVINYLADVLPFTRRLSAPVCQSCHAARPWSEYLAWKRCGACGARRTLRSWLVMVLTLGAILALWLGYQGIYSFWLASLVVIYFGTVIAIDVEHRLILHPVSLAGVVLGLAVGISMRGPIYTLLGGAAGFGIMLVLYYLGGVFARWLARRRGQEIDEEALGYGDVNLTGVLGLIMGWPAIITALIVAILLGGVAGLLYIVFQVATRRYQPFSAIPYAPFLILGAVVLLASV